MAKKKLWWWICGGLLVILLMTIGQYSMPSMAYSTVVNDRSGNLLNASIASDGQWRFPVTDSVPHKMESCIRLFEDEYFYYHPGINPFSIARAAYHNIRAGVRTSGASTITMQLARMLRGRDRTFLQKLIEMGLALRLELSYSKTDILRYYASFAPFGGNVVGMDAASWRYFGRPAHLLSWSESATLAVLPNQPGLIYPGEKASLLKKKRNFLLKKLLDNGVIDNLTYTLSLSEPLPGKPYSIPQKAPHLLSTIRESQEGKQVQTTIDPYWQQRTTEIAERHHAHLKSNGIENLAILVVDLNDGKVLAYTGNTTDPTVDGHHVDVIQRRRSSGSILKPLLYAAALDEGLILPHTLLPDIPTFFGGYTPKNFNYGYEGVVHADRALAMSLNIPFTYLLKDYSYERFHQNLQTLGITTLEHPPGHYGLSLILGGAEVKLWDLAQVYFSLYRKLANEANYSISYLPAPQKQKDVEPEQINIWHTFDAMTHLTRPGSDHSWQNFNSSQLIAWKTGTSFGFRDAWAIGLNGEVLVAVWAGNADGEGRAGLSGAAVAGPILTELVRLSAHDPDWLKALKPFSVIRSTCAASGMLAGPLCPARKEVEVGQHAERAGICSYHKQVWTDNSGSFLVNRSCYPANLSITKTLFILPPTEGLYYRKNHSDYNGMPEVYPGCEHPNEGQIVINYPAPNARIYIPRELDGTYGNVVIEASHLNPEATLYWHLDDEFIGSTRKEHKQSLMLSKGTYRLTLIDEQGNHTTRKFTVISDRTHADL